MATGTKRLAAEEDLLLGYGQIEQERGGSNYIVTKINAGSIPYSGSKETGDLVTVKDVIEQILASTSVNVVTEW